MVVVPFFHNLLVKVLAKNVEDAGLNSSIHSCPEGVKYSWVHSSLGIKSFASTSSLSYTLKATQWPSLAFQKTGLCALVLDGVQNQVFQAKQMFPWDSDLHAWSPRKLYALRHMTVCILLGSQTNMLLPELLEALFAHAYWQRQEHKPGTGFHCCGQTLGSWEGTLSFTQCLPSLTTSWRTLASGRYWAFIFWNSH